MTKGNPHLHYLGFIKERKQPKRDCRESIGVYSSTICRELQRNRDDVTQEYYFAFTETKSQRRQQNKAKYEENHYHTGQAKP